MKIKNTKTRMMRAALYIVLIVLAFLMLVPFAWMLSASFKLDKDVFIFPIQWIPTNPRWQNYVDIWTRIPLLKFVLNTVKLTLIVTFLQLLTSSFAAYAFSKLNFKGKHVLFLAYIATIAVPWQVYRGSTESFTKHAAWMEPIHGRDSAISPGPSFSRPPFLLPLSLPSTALKYMTLYICWQEEARAY